MKQNSLPWRPASCVQKYGLLHPLPYFFLCCWVLFFGGLALQFALKGFNLPLHLAYGILHCCHGGGLGGHVIGVFYDLSHQVHVCAIDVSHFHPAL